MGGARPPPFTTFTLTSKVAVYAPAEWADTLTLCHLYQYLYSVVRTREVAYMERPTQPNMGPSLADVLLCTFESINAGFSSFTVRKLLS